MRIWSLSYIITYDMHYSVLLDLEYFGPGSSHLWNENRGDDKGAALPHLNFSPFGGSARGDYFCSRDRSARRGQLSDVRAIETKRASASTAEWEITRASSTTTAKHLHGKPQLNIFRPEAHDDKGKTKTEELRT